MNIQEVATKIGQIVSEKNESYGNAFIESADLLKILYPKGIKPEDYRVIDPVLRIFHKLKRIAQDEGAFGEDAWLDIAGYGILMSWYRGQSTEAHTKTLEATSNGSGILVENNYRRTRNYDYSFTCSVCGGSIDRGQAHKVDKEQTGPRYHINCFDKRDRSLD